MWKTAASSEDLEADRPVSVKVDGLEILLVRTESGLFALEDSCPHQKQPLSTGSVKGDKLTCRHHGIEIDMNTGKVTWAMGFLGLSDVGTFPVREESGSVWIDC